MGTISISDLTDLSDTSFASAYAAAITDDGGGDVGGGDDDDDGGKCALGSH